MSTDWLFSFDPGLRRLGWASWFEEELVAAGAVTQGDAKGSAQWMISAHAVWDDLWTKTLPTIGVLPGHTATVAVELMEMRKGRSDAFKSLVDLVGVTGAIHAHGHEDIGVPVEHVDVLPSVWTNMIAKERHQYRTKELLRPDERAVFDAAARRVAPSQVSELTDAVGVGLWVLERR